MLHEATAVDSPLVEFVARKRALLLHIPEVDKPERCAADYQIIQLRLYAGDVAGCGGVALELAATLEV